jgi:tetratricopeptide (TPR) repeat protein
MRSFIVAAVVLAAFLAPRQASAKQVDATGSKLAPAAPADDAVRPPAPKTQAEQDELDARLMMAEKRYAEAAQVYEKLAREYPHNPSYPNFAGIAAMQQADLEGARKMFQRATKVDKNFADAFNNLGTVWFSMKDYKRAISQYQKALALRPDTAAYYTNLGYAYFNRQNVPEALDMFHKALAIDPGVLDQTGRDGPVLQDRSVNNRGLFSFMMAKSYAQVGDAPHCALYLRKAFEDGYKEMGKARSDPAFAALLTNPEVQSVLDQADPLPPVDAPAAPANPPGW